MAAKRSRAPPLYWLWVLFLTLLTLSVTIVTPAPLVAFRFIAFDTFQRLSPRVWDPESPVRIIDVDEGSLERLGQWPWPRSELAELVEKLAGVGAAAIVFDMVLAERDRASGTELIRLLPDIPSRDLVVREIGLLEDNDARFSRVLNGKPVVLGAQGSHVVTPRAFPTKQGWSTAGDDPRPFVPTFASAVVPIPDFWGTAAGIGLLNWLPDRDQTVRRVPLVARVGDTLAPSLALEALRVAQGTSTVIVRSANASGEGAFGARTGVNAVRVGALNIETDASASIAVRFTPHEPRRFFPAWQVLAGEVPAAEFEGRIILIGTSAAGLLDQRATPLDASVPGVEVHAQVLEHILAGGRLIRPDWAPGVELLLIVLLCGALALAVPRISAVVVGPITVAAIATLVVGTFYVFEHAGLLIDPAPAVAGAILVYLGGTVVLYRHEQAQKALVRGAFERFVAPPVVARLAENPNLLILGGELRNITVLFADLRNFTTISEGMSPQDLTTFINEYLTPMTELIMEYGGTVDKYMGDGIMAFWNAPLDDRDHARNAAQACLAMMDELKRLNAAWQQRALRDGIARPLVQAGFGLSTGDCVVGNLGSARRFDYSAIGDEVNIAARLESATKFYGVDLLASEATRNRSRDLRWLEIDRVRLKGKVEAVSLFTLVPSVGLDGVRWAALKGHHKDTIKHYRRRRFAKAIESAQSAANSAPGFLAGYYEMIALRCRSLAEVPPSDDWDGVTNLSEK